MEKRLHKRIRIISFIAIIVGFIGLIMGSRSLDEGLPAFGGLFIVFAFISLISSFAIRFQENILLRKISKGSLVLLPFVAVVCFIITYLYPEMNTSTMAYLAVVMSVFTIIAFIHLFIYSDATSLWGILILMLFFIVGIELKRNHMFGASYTITLSCGLLSIGCFMYGIRCLFLINKLTYLRNIAFFGGCFNVIGFLGFAFKMQHWIGAGYLVIVGFVAMIIGTFIVLLTLPSSGFIDWQPFYKKIFRRVLIPWTLIFILFILRFMLPNINNVIWGNDKKINRVGFGMTEYPVEIRNGLDSK
jgi:hypothetical protein